MGVSTQHPALLRLLAALALLPACQSSSSSGGDDAAAEAFRAKMDDGMKAGDLSAEDEERLKEISAELKQQLEKKPDSDEKTQPDQSERGSRHEWHGAPSQYREPTRERKTKSERVGPACTGHGTLKVEGPEKPKEGYGFLTLVYAVSSSPCIEEMNVNGEPAKPEPKPCQTYRFPAGIYSMELEAPMYDIKKTHRINIKEDQWVLYPHGLMRCVTGKCGRSHDCPELEEEMRRLRGR